MIIENKIDQLFSGNVIFAGYLFLLPGAYGIYNNDFSTGGIIFGSIIILASCFVIFTSEHVKIDTEKKQVKRYCKLFGFIKNGKWENLDQFRGVTLIPIRKVEGMASMSNRTTSSVKKDYRIFLVNRAKKPAFAIKRCLSKEKAQNSLDEFSIWLKLPVFSPKIN